MALGAVGPGHELSIPVMFRHLLGGLERHALGEGALDYFRLHIEQDQLHAKVFNALIERCPGGAGLEKVRQGALFSLKLRSRFWEGCAQAVFGSRGEAP